MENRLPSDCAEGGRCRNNEHARTIMDKELELLKDKTDGRSSTASVKLPQPKGGRFVALPNSPVVGNEFLPDVAEAGASAAIVSDPTRAMNSPSDLALLQVQDTLTALHKLAPGYRQLMPQRPLSLPSPISSGRATAKQPAMGPAAWLCITRTTSKLQATDRRAPQLVATRGRARSAFRDNQTFEPK